MPKTPAPEYQPWRAKRFRPQQRDSAAEAPAPDYLEGALLYRRIPPTTFDGAPVDTTMRWFVGSGAAFLHSASRNGGTTGRRREDDEMDSMDGLLACLVTSGRFRVETNGRSLDLAQDDIFLLDSAVPHLMHDYPGHIVVVFVPRAGVAAALDASHTADFVGRLLTDSDLADLFALQVRYLVGALDRIAPAAFDVALSATADVALGMLRGADRRPEADGTNIVARAKLVVSQSASDPELTPTRIAKLLGVSRTRLYEAFAGQGLTLGTYLRDRRLQTFLTLLREDPDIPIQELAARSGFGGSASDFTKLFRRTYGVLPSDMRTALLEEGILGDRLARRDG